jgi:predicted amidophosphoribosyltransferase
MPAAILSPEDEAQMQALAEKYGLKSVYLESTLLFNPNGGLSGNCCPECGNPLRHEGGCETCHGCGFSRCG